MKNAGKFIAMLLRRWTSKTPKRSKIISIAMGVVGSAAFITLAIPSFGLPLWASIGVGVIAATSSAYEQLKDETNKTVIKESRQIFQSVDK